MLNTWLSLYYTHVKWKYIMFCEELISVGTNILVEYVTEPSYVCRLLTYNEARFHVRTGATGLIFSPELI